MPTALLNVYSLSELEFIQEQAQRQIAEQEKWASAPRLYTQEDVRLLADWMIKEAAMIGQGGWLWDTNMNAGGNLSGYGGMVGQGIGSFLGYAGGTPGGMAGGAAGGIAGRGLGHLVGSGIDYVMGNKPGEGQKGMMETVFNPTDIAIDTAAGAIPGVGRAAGAGLKAVGKKVLGQGVKEVGEQVVKNVGSQAARTGGGVLSRMGRAIPQPVKNFARKGWNMMSHPIVNQMTLHRPLAAAGAGMLGFNGGGAMGGAGGSMAGNAMLQSNDPFANTQGYTKVLGNTNRGFSGVKPFAGSYR